MQSSPASHSPQCILIEICVNNPFRTAVRGRAFYGRQAPIDIGGRGRNRKKGSQYRPARSPASRQYLSVSTNREVPGRFESRQGSSELHLAESAGPSSCAAMSERPRVNIARVRPRENIVTQVAPACIIYNAVGIYTGVVTSTGYVYIYRIRGY